MGLKKHLISTINIMASLYLKNRGLSISIGQESHAFLWKIRLNGNAAFKLGNQSLITTNIVFERPNAVVSIGNRTFIGGKGVFSASDSITVGDDVLIAWGCTITDHDSHNLSFAKRSSDVVNYIAGHKDWTNVSMAAVHVRDKVWIGFNCSVLKGVTIGEGAVVAANSNVTKDVPPWTLVAGNPARVIRELSPE